MTTMRHVACPAPAVVLTAVLVAALSPAVTSVVSSFGPLPLALQPLCLALQSLPLPVQGGLALAFGQDRCGLDRLTGELFIAAVAKAKAKGRSPLLDCIQ